MGLRTEPANSKTPGQDTGDMTQFPPRLIPEMSPTNERVFLCLSKHLHFIQDPRSSEGLSN